MEESVVDEGVDEAAVEALSLLSSLHQLSDLSLLAHTASNHLKPNDHLRLNQNQSLQQPKKMLITRNVMVVDCWELVESDVDVAEDGGDEAFMEELVVDLVVDEVVVVELVVYEALSPPLLSALLSLPSRMPHVQVLSAVKS